MKSQILTLLLLSAMMTSCGVKEQKAQTTKKSTPPTWVATYSVAKQDISEQIVIAGEVKPNIVGVVKSPSNGIITKLNVRENYSVKRGDVIAEINPENRVALMAKYENEIRQATNDSLRQRLSEDLSFAKDMYQKLIITSELAGEVSVRYIDNGSQVSAGESLIEIYNPNSLVLKAEVNERYFSIIKKGKVLPLKLMAYPDKEIHGRISLIYPKIDPKTRSIKFDLTISENVELMEGMLAEINLTTNSRDDVLTIPTNSILSNQTDEQFVYCVDADSLVHKRVITTGLSSNGYAEVASGIKEGEKIVIKGQDLLKENKKVKITK
ncbi:MAG: efflux RND transporter periplasmic adaptor subunit [Rikenellaceae bacterium]